MPYKVVFINLFLLHSCSALKFIHFPGLASFSPHVMYVCIPKYVCVQVVYMCVVCVLHAWESSSSSLARFALWILWTLFPKLSCPIHSDVRSLSSSRVYLYVTYTYTCMYVYVCVRIYEYEARIPVSFALHKLHAPRTERATGVNETSLLHAPSASSFKMKSKWDI